MLLTVAMAGLAETHGLVVAGVPEPVSVVVKPSQTFKVPVIVGRASTLTVAVILHPLELVYVMMEVPADTPVTTPTLSTVATAGLAETQGFVAAAVPEPVSVVVRPSQTFKVPLIVGSAFTITVAVMIQPFEFV